MSAFGNALAGIAARLGTASAYLQSLDGYKLVESFDHLATGVGIIMTGAWAVWARRFFSARVEFGVSGRIFGPPGRQYVVPRIMLRNVGNTRISQLKREGSGFRVWYAIPQPEKPFQPLTWSEPAEVESIFEYHHWLEPGESINDEEHVIPLPADWIAMKIEARQCIEIRSPFRRTGAIEVNAAAIIYPTGGSNGAKG